MDGQVLSIEPRGRRKPVSVLLREVRNIEVESDTRVHSGGGGSENRVTLSCVCLIAGRGAARFTLVEEPLVYMYAVEWLGKIRSFLRSHGWTPEGERD
jgi:hypothetical protein